MNFSYAQAPMIVDQHIYRKAFQEYLRKGTPIMWSIKQERPTTHYIWRTRRDSKVRSAHAEREGRGFSWEDPSDVGVEVEDYSPGSILYDNIHKPLNDYLRGRGGIPSNGRQRLGIREGVPYSITGQWSGSVDGKIYADSARSRY